MKPFTYNRSLDPWTWEARFVLGPGSFGCLQERVERGTAISINHAFLSGNRFEMRVRVAFTIFPAILGGPHTNPTCVAGPGTPFSGTADYIVIGILNPETGIITMNEARGDERFFGTHQFTAFGTLNP